MIHKIPENDKMIEKITLLFKWHDIAMQFYKIKLNCTNNKSALATMRDNVLERVSELGKVRDHVYSIHP